MTKEELIFQLIAQGEGEKLDFKEAITSRPKIAKTLVAFANTKGGKLLVGVKDNGKIRGVDVTEEQEMLLWAVEEHTFPLVAIDFETVLIGGKQVLVAEIKESEQKPHFALDEENKKWAYLRSNDQTLKASKVMLDVMQMDSRKVESSLNFGNAEKRLLQFLEENKRVTQKEFSKIANISRRRASQILVQLIRMRIIKVFSHEKEEFYTL